MIKFITPLAIATIMLGVTAATATKAASGDLASGIGHDLAQRLCSNCHLIEPGLTNPSDHVGGPAFQTVADRPNLTPQLLREHLRNTHSNTMIPLAMPNPELTEDELVKIISYIMRLHDRH